MNEQKIHYEPHPVSPARKAELRAQGLTIVDAIYAPKGAAVPQEPANPQQLVPGAGATDQGQGIDGDGQGLDPVADAAADPEPEPASITGLVESAAKAAGRARNRNA